MPDQPQKFQSVEFYRLAAWLYSTRPNECEQVIKRTIIGRAYYAALLGGSKITGVSTLGPSGHQDVINAVRAKDSQAGNQLGTMNKLRRTADYDDSLVNDRDVQSSLRGAKVVLTNLGLIDNTFLPNLDYLDKSKFIVPCEEVAPQKAE